MITIYSKRVHLFCMLQLVIIISLAITGIHIAFQDGNVLMLPRIWIANVLDRSLGKKWSRIVQKPMWDCMPCMASVWGFPFAVYFIGDWRVLPAVLAVSGLNTVIERTIYVSDEPADPLGPHINNHLR